MKTSAELMGFANRYRRWFQSYIYTDLIEVMSPLKAGRVRLEMEADTDEVYTDQRVIHVGLQRLADSNDLFSDTLYMIGHELQHIHSTSQRDWLAGQQRAVNCVLAKISKEVFGREVRSRSKRDEHLICKKLSEHGVYLTPNSLQKTIHFVLNSLEDGRIEGIRHRLHPGFTVYTKLYRRNEWEKAAVTLSGKVPMPASERLTVIMNQILTMSTMQVWQKGFTQTFIDDLSDEGVLAFCNSLIPLIAQAISASTCRKCMDAGVEICNRLIPLILEAAKERESAMDAMLQALMEAIGEGDYSFGKGTEKGGTLPESIFGHSVLVVELEDDEFDEMMKNAQEAEQDGPPSVIFKRKHPKEDDNNQEGNREKAAESSDSASGSGEQAGGEEGAEGSGNASGSGEQTGSEEGTDGSDNASGSGEQAGSEEGAKGSGNASGSGEQAEGKKEAEGSGNASGSGEQTGSEEGAKGSGNASGSGEQTGSEKGTDGSDSASGSGEQQNSKSNPGPEGNETARPAGPLSEEKLAEQINKSADDAEAETTPMRKAAEGAARVEERFRKSDLVVNDHPSCDIDTSDLEAIYADDGPVELEIAHRDYQPNQMLPFALQSRGDAFRRKIERKLQAKQTPKRRGQKAGSIDSSRVASLAMRDLTCFKKRAKSEKVDVAAFILVDNSGSMYGDKHEYALEAAAVVEEGFKARTPLKIAAFDAQSDNHVRHFQAKDWEEKGTANLSYNFLHYGDVGDGNKDGYSIRVATKELLTRPEKNKLLLVLSDGMPTEYRGGQDAGMRDVKDAVETARKAGITVVGIYFSASLADSECSAFKSMYGNQMSICTTPDQIENELTGVMERFFFA